MQATNTLKQGESDRERSWSMDNTCLSGDDDTDVINKSGEEYMISLPTHAGEMNVDVWRIIRVFFVARIFTEDWLKWRA